jgi:nicotinamidase-related amidase
MRPALSALKEGYEVYVVADASGDYDSMPRQHAMARLVQAGAVPMTWHPGMASRLVFWIKCEDLAARWFEKVWVLTRR